MQIVTCAQTPGKEAKGESRAKKKKQTPLKSFPFCKRWKKCWKVVFKKHSVSKFERGKWTYIWNEEKKNVYVDV